MDDTINTTALNQTKRRYTTIWVMLILFGLPYIAAWYFYFNKDDISIASQTNYGTLITPVKQIVDVRLTTNDNGIFNTSALKGKWTIVSIGETACPGSCQDNLYKMRQIRKALGQDRYRIQRLYLLTDTSHITEFNKLLKDYTGTTVVVNTGKEFMEFMAIFKQPDRQLEHGIYIIDPLGNFMMAYPENADAKGILDDLIRLLKVSKIG